MSVRKVIDEIKFELNLIQNSLFLHCLMKTINSQCDGC
jgi:hypothetical protein